MQGQMIHGGIFFKEEEPEEPAPEGEEGTNGGDESQAPENPAE